MERIYELAQNYLSTDVAIRNLPGHNAWEVDEVARLALQRRQYADELAHQVVRLMAPTGVPPEEQRLNVVPLIADLHRPFERTTVLDSPTNPVQTSPIGYPTHIDDTLLPTLGNPESLKSEKVEWFEGRRTFPPSEDIVERLVRNQPVAQSEYINAYGPCTPYFLGKSHSLEEGEIVCCRTVEGDTIWAYIPDDYDSEVEGVPGN